MKPFLILLALVAPFLAAAHARQTDTDGDWAAQSAVLSDTREAERVIRSGDIDNLGFGFAGDFNPFTGRSTDPHAFPFDPAAGDAAGTDRIMVGSGFTGADFPAGQDGYTFDHHPQDRPLKREPVVLPLESLRDVEVKNAVFCLFVDDFQAPEFKSRFQVTCNGQRFPEMERTLNLLNQTGPIGKVIYVPLSQDMLAQLSAETLALDIDDPDSRAGDGFAIDFVKLMVNVKGFLYRGGVTGRVVDDESGEPIPAAKVETAGVAAVPCDADGAFRLKDIPAGLAVVSAGAPGFSSAHLTVDVIGGEESEPVELRLKRSAAVGFAGQQVRAGDRVTLRKIQFDVNSATLRAEGGEELASVAGFLRDNPGASIELSGHTSSEGSAALNRDLSFRRVRACRDFLIGRGIDAGRLTAVGRGPDEPVAPNDTEENRAKNRRVEMKITDL